jgi:uncharacterized membrane protein YbhN (UPF0104 family)
MKTAVALLVAAVAILVLEVVALRDPEDDWPTITAVMRTLPRWAVGLLMFASGVLFGHFWWQ